MNKMSKKSADLILEAVNDLRAYKFPANSKFNMGDWGMHSASDHNPDEKNLCGTSACALGWLSCMPQWIARGLAHKWEKHHDGTWSLETVSGEFWDDLAVKIFDFEEMDADFLFVTGMSHTVEQWCQKATLYVKYRTTTEMERFDILDKIEEEMGEF